MKDFNALPANSTGPLNKLTAQTLAEAFNACGIKASAFASFPYDHWAVEVMHLRNPALGLQPDDFFRIVRVSSPEIFAEIIQAVAARRAEDIRCISCGLTPDQLPEYADLARTEGYANPTEAVKQEEGTYNAATGRFACTDCYIAMGLPSTRKGWKA